jgi:DNA anti-recombination protein RmuC
MGAKPITRLYDNLTVSLGKENAENVTAYCDHKFSTEMENNLKILATKDDLQAAKEELRNEISRLEMKISETKTDHSADISETKTSLTTRIEETKTDLIGKISELRAEAIIKMEEMKTQVSIKIVETQVTNIRWMVGIIIALSLMILGLYFKK